MPKVGKASVMVVVTVVGLAALGGLVWRPWAAPDDDNRASSVSQQRDGGGPARLATTQVGTGSAYRDRVAARPMATAPWRTDSAGDEPSGRGTLAVPSATMLGPASVMTGFPETPEGAVGQLGAIEVSVLQSMDLSRVSEVHDGWALPGAVSPDGWALTRSVVGFLAGAGWGTAKPETVPVVVTPVAGAVKGTDGPGWVVACVLVRVAATDRSSGSTTFGHCERMQWAGGRWLIAPGAAPAPAPHSPAAGVEPGDFGWQRWTTTPPGDDLGPVGE